MNKCDQVTGIRETDLIWLWSLVVCKSLPITNGSDQPVGVGQIKAVFTLSFYHHERQTVLAQIDNRHVKSSILSTSRSPLELGIPLEFGLIEQVFDHVPEIAFFLKDRHGRYLAVNQSLVERCGFGEKHELLGRRAREIFPKELGELYDAQDESVLRTARPILDRLELHWYAGRRPGWCLTTKLPVHDRSGAVIGLVGISRDLRAHEDVEAIPPGFAKAVEFLETHCDETLSPGSLARRAGLPPVRFARLAKRIFRLTPNQLILQKRLNAAARLLIETNRSMADIACTCGFYDHSAMTRAFRSATNMTPTQFRSAKRASPRHD